MPGTPKLIRQTERFIVGQPASAIPELMLPTGGSVDIDLIRPERWPKLITENTTEAMPVVSISLDYVSTAHLAVKMNLT